MKMVLLDNWSSSLVNNDVDWFSGVVQRRGVAVLPDIVAVQG